jgi:hypothetical protein
MSYVEQLEIANDRLQSRLAVAEIILNNMQQNSLLRPFKYIVGCRFYVSPASSSEVTMGATTVHDIVVAIETIESYFKNIQYINIVRSTLTQTHILCFAHYETQTVLDFRGTSKKFVNNNEMMSSVLSVINKINLYRVRRL